MLIIVVAALALVAGSEAVSGPDAAPPFVLPGSISVSPVTSSPSLCIYSEKNINYNNWFYFAISDPQLLLFRSSICNHDTSL